ncbi:hypothetical protein ACIBL3_45510 [Kribbella sp. NPDC050124]|uniref:hypothetical protein n=1 Tax=Kribbella sp. NPDC050124 TaxID=3364114 RepID=UPI003799C607
MSTENRAEELAELTLNAVASVRTRLGRAVESAEQLDGELWEIEKSFQQRPELPREEPAPDARRTRAAVLAAAANYASAVSQSARSSQDRIAELRDGLAAAAAAVTQAKSYLDELEKLPAADSGQPATPTDLRERLGQLESAITTADAGAERTAERLGAALGNARRMQRVFGELDTRSVPVVHGASEALNQGLPGLQAGVGTTSAAYTMADQSTAAANDLANAVRAAANPTPASAQQRRDAAGEQDRRHRPDGPTQTLDR